MASIALLITVLATHAHMCIYAGPQFTNRKQSKQANPEVTASGLTILWAVASVYSASERARSRVLPAVITKAWLGIP